jgi:hypothetical protein
MEAAGSAESKTSERVFPVLKDGGDAVFADCMARLPAKLFRKVVLYV